LTGIDPTNQANPGQAQESSPNLPPSATDTACSQADPPPAPAAATENSPACPPPGAQADGQSAEGSSADAATAADSLAGRPRILIGSQRDPAAYRARRQRDWTPVEQPPTEGEGDSGDSVAGEAGGKEHAGGRPSHRSSRGRRHRDHKGASDHKGVPPSQQGGVLQPRSGEPTPADSPPAPYAPMAVQPPAPPLAPQPQAVSRAPAGKPASINALEKQGLNEALAVPPVVTPLAQAVIAAAADSSSGRITPPSVRARLSPDLETEFAQALGGDSFDDLMASGTFAEQALLEPESRHTAKVVAVRRDDIFVELGSREQGCLSLRLFTEPPQPGSTLDVIVQRFNPEDGLYELSIPGTAASVEDWSDLNEGMLVEAKVTGHNTGGLEAEVNHIRAFIPISQVALYRVDDLAPFVGQHFACLVTEANPSRRNLVLSRRAVLEREKEEERQKFFSSLAPGQIHQGVVRKLMDFGAFIDIGGADGLLHVSQLAWGRVNHPSDVLTVGQSLQVKIEKINPETGKISLSYRELLENPWTNAAGKFAPNSIVRGKVTKLMEFGAFVELEPGIEGLVHISELAPKRVWRASDVVHEGEEVEVMVLSVNAESQRISLSMKALAKPEPTKKEQEQEAAAAAPASAPSKSKQKHRSDETLRGGLGRGSGARFGLKW
jgi:small subunit ribosomal protein S1